eukprot:NODE_358_length_10198_cov_0.265076.p4 type:complete len:283 gc:universal NODE_358_length_10198_cov_0.265076:5600-4752(-)
MHLPLRYTDSTALRSDKNSTQIRIIQTQEILSQTQERYWLNGNTQYLTHILVHQMVLVRIGMHLCQKCTLVIIKKHNKVKINMFCFNFRKKNDFLTLSYLIDRLLLLSTHVDLMLIPWISPFEKRLQFIDQHIQQIKCNNLHILTISNCEVLLFIIRKWEFEPFFTKKEVLKFNYESKSESFEVVFARYLRKLSLEKSLLLLLVIRLLKKLTNSNYQNTFRTILVTPALDTGLIEKLSSNCTMIEKELFPFKFIDNVPKLLVNSESIKLSSTHSVIPIPGEV